MPDPDARTRFEDELRRTYNIAQLRSIVWWSLNERLDDIVFTGAPYQTVVFDFVSYLEQEDAKLNRFLDGLTVNTSPQLLSAIRDYLGRPQPTDDPYDALVIYRRPFVDRRLFRARLRECLSGSEKPFLFVRGPRSSGRSFSVKLIDHVLANEGKTLVFVDLLDESVEDAVDQITTRMELDPTQLRDREAQAAAQAKGVAWEIQRRGKEFGPQDRWCLVFDHYDQAAPPRRDFFDVLAKNLIRPCVRGVWVVVLGHDGPLPPGTADHSIEDTIGIIQRADVAQFIRRLFEESNRDASEGAVDRACDLVLDGLNVPFDPALDPTGLCTMEDRLKNLL